MEKQEKSRGPGRKPLRILLITVIVLLVIGTLGFFGFYAWTHYFHTGEAGTYVAAADTSVYTSRVLKSSSNSSIAVGQSVEVTSTLKDLSGNVWGDKKEGYYVLLADEEYTYFLPADQVQFETEPVSSRYALQETVQVYAYPVDGLKPVDTLEPDTSSGVFITDSYTDDQGRIWGSLGENLWVILQDGNTVYLKEDGEEALVEKYAGEPGWYYVNYTMYVRDAPGYDSNAVSTQFEGSYVEVFSFQGNLENNSVWAQIGSEDSGQWICLRDDEIDDYLIPLED